MRKSIKAILATVLSSAMLLTLTGCGKKSAEEQAAEQKAKEEAVFRKELTQNDYRGGIIRTSALKTNILAIMQEMKANNQIIRQDSPNSYWTTDGYQDFVSTFLSTDVISDTALFNEEETSWDTIIQTIASQKNSFSDGSGEGKLLSSVSVWRNEKDDYSVTGVPRYISFNYNGAYYSYSENADYRILYDCDKDWCKTYVTMPFKDANNITGTTDLFEYQRISPDVFAIQTSTERLLVVLEPTETDTSLADRRVKEFYYSRLVSDGVRTTFKPYEPLPEVDQNNISLKANQKLNETMAENPYINTDGDIFNRYGKKESMFFKPSSEITPEWVFEDKALQQGITYADGVLVATTYNKLSTYYERFIYSKADADTSNLSNLEDMVHIENLVGVKVTEVMTPTTDDDTTSDTSGETSENTSSSATSDTSATSTDSNVSNESGNVSESNDSATSNSSETTSADTSNVSSANSTTTNSNENVSTSQSSVVSSAA